MGLSCLQREAHYLEDCSVTYNEGDGSLERWKERGRKASWFSFYPEFLGLLEDSNLNLLKDYGFAFS